MNIIYTRISYHRERILALDTITDDNNKYLISLCVEGYIKIVSFSND